ncbi:STAS domain-containing protein [Gemmatimonadota bacterium]
MTKVLDAMKDRLVFKAPQLMSGPKVHLLKQEILKSLDSEDTELLIDFSDVAYIDLHGLVLFRDICDLVRTAGKKAYAYMLQPQLLELLAEVNLLAEETEGENSDQYMIKTA